MLRAGEDAGLDSTRGVGFVSVHGVPLPCSMGGATL